MKMIILAAVLPIGLVLAASFLITAVRSLLRKRDKPERQDNDL